MNWDVKEPLEKRRLFRDIFKDTALKLAESGEVCIMSTEALWKIYNKLISHSSPDYINEIKEKIKTTNGILEVS